MTQLVHIRDGHLAAVVYEPKARKADAILIHGYTGSKEDFSEIGPLLAEAGYRVVTSDNRGQHESEHSYRDDAYTIPSLARDHLELARYFGLENPHLFGHSFGGLVAQRAAVEFPSEWASLTIFCSGPGGMPEWTLLNDDIAFLENHSLAELWEKNEAVQKRGLTSESLHHLRWHKSDKRSVATHALHLTAEPSIVAQVKATGLPVHVIRGENDDAWPHDLQAKMAADLGVEIEIIADAGHCPNEDRPEETARVIASFWDELS
jgi:pimeloyl-ACP methyl ester carboxylesterase